MHLHLLLFWNTTKCKGVHCMFKAADMTSFFPRLVTSKLTPPFPSLSIIDLYQKTSLATLPWKIRVTLVLVFHRVLQLQSANNIQFGEWPFVSVALVSRGIQQWNRTQPSSKRHIFSSVELIIVKLILFSKLFASSEFNFWSFSNQKNRKKSLTLLRQAALKTKLLIVKRERKYFILSLTTFSCVIQHSIAKQMLW